LDDHYMTENLPASHTSNEGWGGDSKTKSERYTNLQTALKAVPQSPPQEQRVDSSVVDQPLTAHRTLFPADNFFASPMMRPLGPAYHTAPHDDFMGELDFRSCRSFLP